jgi:hypothetical protein
MSIRQQPRDPCHGRRGARRGDDGERCVYPREEGGGRGQSGTEQEASSSHRVFLPAVACDHPTAAACGEPEIRRFLRIRLAAVLRQAEGTGRDAENASQRPQQRDIREAGETAFITRDLSG